MHNLNNLQLSSEESYDWQSVISLSSTCRAFRAASLEILFRSVNLTFERRVVRRGQTLIEFLIDHPHISGSIRSIAVWRVDGFKCDSHQRELLQQLFPRLTGLKSIHLQELDASTLPIVDLVRENARPVHLVIAQHIFGQVYDGISANDLLSYLGLPTSSALSLTLDAHMPSAVWNVVRSILVSAFKIRAVKFRQWLSESHRVALPPSKLDYDALFSAKDWLRIAGLEEFHASDVLLKQTTLDSQIFSAFSIVDFGLLKRLSLTGRAMVEDLFPRAAEKLYALECLHLSSPNPQSFLYAVGLVGSAYDHSIPAQEPPIRSRSPFLKLPKLVDLTLDGVSNSFPIDYLAASGLKSVRLHLRETFNTNRTQGARSAEDLKLLCELCPSISKLELDIGDISSLWHSVAVPGVDVDVRIYPILQQLATFPHLRYLRLFPPYIVKGTQRNRFPIYRQTLSDEQAIRMFRRLRLERTSLEQLSITADAIVAKDAVDFDCMSWTVSQMGEQTSLVTRQANKNYEQRQIWEGERRLRTEIKRYSYPRSYLFEQPGWIFD